MRLSADGAEGAGKGRERSPRRSHRLLTECMRSFCSQVCQWGAICAENGGNAVCECPTCPAEFQPVCGDDGISYGNECKLRLEACQHRREIRVLYQGLCSEYRERNYPVEPCPFRGFFDNATREPSERTSIARRPKPIT